MKTVRLAFALPLLSLAAATGAACGGGNENLPPSPPPPDPPALVDAGVTQVTTTPPADTGAAKPAAPPPPVLTPGTAAPDPTPAPTVKILSPSREQVIAADKASDFEVKLDVKNWQTAVGSSHVHLILDNRPYKPIYDTKAPVKLSELTNKEALAEGLHVITAFPSRASHESVKSKDALVVIPFWVGKKGDLKVDPTKKPLLIYSRPKGDYNGEMANHVLVDFQVANVTLAEGKEHVHVTITGNGIATPIEGNVTKFGQPMYIDNAQSGSYTIKLELLDGSNKLVDGPWNSTTRTIKIDHDAAMDPNMGHGPAGGAADAGAPKK